MKLEHIISRNLVVMDKNSYISEIGKTMSDYDIGFMPISEGDKIIGLITDRDIATKVVANEDKHIDSYITTNIITVDINESLENVVKIMGKKKVKRLLVTDEDKLVGIVSFSDLLNTNIDSNLILENLKKIYEINRNTDTYLTTINEFYL